MKEKFTPGPKIENLIAAAPDMYEALKAFKAYMVGPRDLQALLIMVDAAIAKADGTE